MKTQATVNSIDVIEIDSKQFEKQLASLLCFPNIKINNSIEESMHFKYFVNYLLKDPNGLQAKTIVQENDYMSLSYLGDYKNYYSLCHKEYGKFCKRVHFFQKKFNGLMFQEMLLRDLAKHKPFWDSYLGYIVVKPLPRGIIGATLLKPYINKSERFYSAVRPYPVNICGKKLIINTLAYQEQDTIVGECATSALWFAFNKTQQLFKTALPNPSDITMLAGNDSFNRGVDFQNQSLDLSQIHHAISAIGLSSDTAIDTAYLQKDKLLKAFTYAYLKMGIPVLIGLDIEKQQSPHLVTVNGYSYGLTNIKKTSNKVGNSTPIDKIELISDDITKLYAHDDQVGPFAKLEFFNNTEVNESTLNQVVNSTDYQFKTSWWDNIESKEVLNASASSITVPLKKTIKITFKDIFEQVASINYSIKIKLNSIKVNIDFNWEIYLCKGTQYKSHVLNDIYPNNLKTQNKNRDILFKSLPEFVWVARAFLKLKKKYYLMFSILYDAADIDIIDNSFYTDFYNGSLKELFKVSNMLDNNGNIFFPGLTSVQRDKSVVYTLETEINEVLNNKSIIDLSEIENLYNESRVNKLVKKQYESISAGFKQTNNRKNK